MREMACKGKLPGFLQVKQTPNQGRGIFTKKRICCGDEVFRCKPYVVGVSATTPEGVKQLCQQCLKSIPTPSSAIVCGLCNAVAYCSKPCQDEALPVHRVECEGFAGLEKMRGKSLYVPFRECRSHYWPPGPFVLVARALNRKVLEGKSFDEWEIASLSKPEKLPPFKEETFKNCQQLMWPLVLKSITTEEMMYDAYCRISINCCESGNTLHNIQGVALYTEYSLLNHCCAPNCMTDTDDGFMVVTTLRDIKKGEQLSIGYIRVIYQLLPREIRRNKLMEVFGFECVCPVCMEEGVVGSDRWLLEQQKKAFIVPWSRERAHLAMGEGVHALMHAVTRYGR